VKGVRSVKVNGPTTSVPSTLKSVVPSDEKAEHAQRIRINATGSVVLRRDFDLIVCLERSSVE
jgi:hypothetical protein